MSLFGKKKLSLDDILNGIEDLTEEERAQVLAKMQPQEETVEQEEVATDEAVEDGAEETTETSAEGEEPAESNEPEEESAPVEEEPTPTEETDDGEEAPAPVSEAPLETPTPETEESEAKNYDEIIAAQDAKINSLESQLSALKATVEQIVSKQDNQNFGHSPRANFDDDVSKSRSDAIFQSYAPRRADQYK